MRKDRTKALKKQIADLRQEKKILELEKQKFEIRKAIEELHPSKRKKFTKAFLKLGEIEAGLLRKGMAGLEAERKAAKKQRKGR
jgi:regulator of replication initiation timing